MSDRRALPLPFPSYTLTSNQLVLAASAFWAVALNRPFFAAALRGHALAEPGTWQLAIALAVAVVALLALLLGLAATVGASDTGPAAAPAAAAAR